MVKLNRIWIFLLCVVIFLGFNYQYAQWLGTRDHNDTYRTQGDERPSDPEVDGTWVDIENPISQSTTITSNKSIWILHLPRSDNYDTELWYLLAIIQIAVNWILWILAFVALVYMLYNWFLVLSAGSDDKNVSKWKKWVKTAAIAIMWIWIAWLIVSAMIWFIRVITASNW